MISLTFLLVVPNAKRHLEGSLDMLGEEHTHEWITENVKNCPISNSIDLMGK